MVLAPESQLDQQIRHKTVDAAKRYRASWIQLGQFLYSIHKDKLYKQWGFQTFEGYCKKDLHLKPTTAAKLLKSYRFLEREEPRIAEGRVQEDESPKALPDYESVNLLRLAAQNKQYTPGEVAEVRESVIEKGKEPKEVRAQMKRILEAKDTTPPEEQKQIKRNASIKRMVAMIRHMEVLFESEKMVPKYLINQMQDLVEKLEGQIEE